MTAKVQALFLVGLVVLLQATVVSCTYACNLPAEILTINTSGASKIYCCGEVPLGSYKISMYIGSNSMISVRSGLNTKNSCDLANTNFLYLEDLSDQNMHAFNWSFTSSIEPFQALVMVICYSPAPCKIFVDFGIQFLSTN